MQEKSEKSERSMPMGPGGPGGPPGRGPGGPPGMRPQEKAKNAKGVLFRVVGYLLSFKAAIAAVFALVIFSTLSNLGATYITSPVINAIGADTIDYGYIAALLLLLAGLYLLSAAAQGGQGVLLAVISQRTVQKIRKEMFEKMEKLSVSFFDKNTHGELMSRMTNDVDTLSQTLSNSIMQIFSGVMTLVGTFLMMIYVSPLMTVVTLLLVPLMLFLTNKIATHTRKFYIAQQASLGTLNGHIEETISGQYAVKVFCREEKICEEFSRKNTDYYNNAVKAQILSGVVAPLMGMFNNLNYAITAFVGGLLAVNQIFGFDPLSVGDVVLFLSLSNQFSRPINEIANLFSTIQSALAGAERVFEIMDEPNEYVGEEDYPEFGDVVGDVDINHIDFGYDDKRLILKDVSIKAKRGQTIALVGPTGAGKTTIVNLLTRFYDVNKGEICLDGTNIKNVAKDSVRAKIAIVLQDTHMFSISVRENIRYGNLNATDEDVEYATRLANCHEFIERLPQGYDTILTDDASNVSMGQRQLLSIARAMVANPDILILDEATSNVDTRTELNIQEAMKNLMLGRTSFVIAHRLSTIREADKIIVINDGRIVEEGSHKELLAKGGMYADLYNGQFNE
ncbi:MAG: ABC transporter ATP-binding protein/permease [Clostridia bacterium]|nr:ABC transporter ATP-binding protein/permease [Clostridia bacterium]